MADLVSLTFAELEYLLAESTTWPQTRASLGLAEADGIADVRASGLSSLLVRGLARVDGADVVRGGDVVAAASLLAVPRRWIEYVVRATSGVRLGAIGYAGGGDALLVDVVAPGVFEIVALAATSDPGPALATLVISLLDSPGEVAVVAREGARPSPALIAFRDEGDSYAVRGAGAEAGTTGLTVDGARDVASAFLRAHVGGAGVPTA